MAYSTRADVVDRLAALPCQGVESKLDSRITGGIEYADSIIDAKLAARYRTPFRQPVPILIKNISADLATWKTLKGAFGGGGEDEEPALANSYKADAMELLCQLADGTLKLEPDAAPPPDEGESAIVPNHSRLGQRPTLESFDLYNEPRGRGWCPF